MLVTMMLEVYFIIAALAISLIAIGFWKEKPFIYTVGFTFIFFLGIIMMNLSFIPGGTTAGIEYKTGLTITESGGSQTITYSYTTFSNRIIGFIIAFLGFGLFAFTLYDPRVKFR